MQLMETTTRTRDERAATVAFHALDRLWDQIGNTFADVPYEWEQELSRIQRNLLRIEACKP
jgi:hypothetical protein